MIEAVGIIIIGVVIILLILLSRRKKRAAKDTSGELSELREKIKGMETYKMRELYTSPNDNNGMTIAGTLLEQFLDISIEVFNQPLVKEVLDKIIKDSGDASVVAGIIEDIGGVIKESIKKNDLLQCLTKLDCKNEMKTVGEPEGGEDLSKLPDGKVRAIASRSVTKCRIGDTDEFVEIGAVLDEKVIDEGQVDSEGRVRNRVGRAGTTVSMYVDGPEWKSSDKANCHRYRTKDESFEKIAREVQKKIGEMMMDPEKQKLYYDTFVQIGKNNTDFLINHHSYINAGSKRDGGNWRNPFEEGGEFVRYFPREHALGEMTKLGSAIKEGKAYAPQRLNVQ
jgi:hypothetical protein